MASEKTPKVCGDPFPHLRLDFETCTKPCEEPAGHRPETAHRCADGHEWLVDADAFVEAFRTQK